MDYVFLSTNGYSDTYNNTMVLNTTGMGGNWGPLIQSLGKLCSLQIPPAQNRDENVRC